MAEKSPQEYLHAAARESIAVKEAFLVECGAALQDASRAIADSLRGGGKLLIFGNGGSAADAQHMAAEMIGRLILERRALPAIALTTNSSNLTAIGNDYSYEVVFSRQIEALARKGDVVVAISTSGNSKNVLAAIRAAKTIGCKVIGLTGGTGGQLKGTVDICLNVSEGRNSCRIQETHIFAIHLVVDLLDRYFLAGTSGGATS